MTLLSIITINYNNAEGLRKTIDSVRMQKFTDYEHIIVDGGSTDGSVDVIKEALSDADYVKHVSWWCSENDSGLYNAMNKGIRHARGEWVYMLNSGDALVKNVLEQLSPELKTHCNQIVYGAVDCYNENGYLWTQCKNSKDIDTGMFPHQGFFSPRIFHEKYGFYDENFKILADWDYVLRLRENNCSFYHTPMIIADYDFSGISSQMTPLYKAEIKLIHARYNIKPSTNKIKKFIKLFIPPFIILLYRRIIK